MAKVMLVEDDNNLREIYEARLQAEGYEIISARDGEKPEVIISDIMMPKISGFDMVDILRTTPETKDAKIVVMTALNQAEDKVRAEKVGADKYLVKSQVTLEDVVKVTKDLLGETVAPAGTTVEPSVAPATADVTPIAVATPSETATPAATTFDPVAIDADGNLSSHGNPTTDTPQANNEPASTDTSAPAAEPTTSTEPSATVPPVDQAAIDQQINNLAAPAPTPDPAPSTAAEEPVATAAATPEPTNEEKPETPPQTPEQATAEQLMSSLANPDSTSEAAEVAPSDASSDNNQRTRGVIQPLNDITTPTLNTAAAEAEEATPVIPTTPLPVTEAPVAPPVENTPTPITVTSEPAETTAETPPVAPDSSTTPAAEADSNPVTPPPAGSTVDPNSDPNKISL